MHPDLSKRIALENHPAMKEYTFDFFHEMILIKTL